jgi:predicted metal-dependent hydrolase
MNSVTKEYKGIGPVLFEFSRRARRMNLSVRPFKGVRVAIPRGCSFEDAERFLLQQREWLKKNIPKIQQQEQEHRELPGESLNIDIVAVAQKLQSRLDELAQIHSFSYNRVTLRKQKTLWASCSHANNISLNIQLAKLPGHLVDYVLIHELVHTKIKNHGPRFWQKME